MEETTAEVVTEAVTEAVTEVTSEVIGEVETVTEIATEVIEETAEAVNTIIEVCTCADYSEYYETMINLQVMQYNEIHYIYLILCFFLFAFVLISLYRFLKFLF